MATLSEREVRPDRHPQAGVGRRVHGLRQAGALAAEQQHLVGPIAVVEIRAGRGGGQDDQLEPFAPAPVLKGGE